ncbi:TonB-dependent receptor [candidate division KSB1 bacterium]|nr:TonB-dependent receptor [candidate division KSB1 bacterium]NIR70453.1 TonB-dependent receptor [candidate division KSB1 bacterium]NIS23183.1 TonB-dependent receptor [candidate division KSB1 bacterium]NIT70043.1 TonB-dependent receptor [candidate division KSB1 bacterium]NIU23680.1 TonB-dependent receptor [candidate division KSB1 bacterium]
MKAVISAWIFCLMAHAASAQNASPSGVLEGYVLKRQTNDPLEGANVILTGTQKGDATDESGYFKIDQIIPGQYELQVQLIGYKTNRLKLEIEPNQNLRIHIKLEPRVLEGSEVTVEGERVEDIRLEVTPPSFEIKLQEVKEMAGALEDVMRSVLTLPGVHATSDFSNQFIVRGGGPDQNLILLDYVELFNPYRNSGMPSLINPSIVRDVNLYAGGYPALFGDRLSSVLTVHTRDGTTQKWLGGDFGVNLTTANFLIEGKIPMWDGSWFVSNRRTYNQLFAEDFAGRLTLNNVAFPDFEDWHFKMVLNPNTKHRIQLHGIVACNNQDFLIKDELGEQESERETFDGEDEIRTTVVGGSWTFSPSQNLQTSLFTNWYQNDGDSRFAGDFAPTNDRSALAAQPPLAQGPPPPVFAEGDTTFLFAHNQQFEFRKLSAGGWLVYERGRHVMETGFGIDLLKNGVNGELELSEFGEVVFDALKSAPNWFGALGDRSDQNSSYKKSYFYLQDKISFLNRKAFIQPGLRFDYYGLIDQGYFSPRLKLSYKLDPVTTIQASWGVYRQSPGFEKLLDGGQVFDLLRFEDFEGLSAERAIHSVIGLQKWLNDQWRLTFEAYHKKFDDLIDQVQQEVVRPVAVYASGPPALAESYFVRERPVFEKIAKPMNDIKGTAFGLDFRLEKRVIDPADRWSGWLSYSLGKSTREQTFDGVRMSYPYNFDRRHSMNLILNYRLGRHWMIGFTWRYGTGFAFTPALRAEPLIAQVAPDPDNPEEVKPTILTDPETGFARFIPDFGGPENLNSKRHSDYHRLDGRITFTTKWFNSDWQFYLEAINIYNRGNVLFLRSIINIEGVRENLPPALQFPTPVVFREPVYMYPFIPSFGLSVSF